ncbi:BamA/TamA family outer membrane protein [Membranihabitans marinus]|uniref:BamA/TamA family outer membrane protein n=1 Tax=Membranihabitans marinus TaxID=1227546 RepID=UPI001F0031A0|nr:BamA/TamA family outer membrane protein [Membranihabitans marinus]
MIIRYTVNIVYLFLFLSNTIWSQSPIYVIDSGCPNEIKEYWQASDSIPPQEEEFKKLSLHLGYPYASMDTIQGKSIILCGPVIRTVGIQHQNLPAIMVSASESSWQYQSWNEVMPSRKLLLSNLANLGYPYAQLSTDIVEIRKDTLLLNYHIDTVHTVYIQKITIDGDLSMNHDLFLNMIGLQQQQVFSWEDIQNSLEIIKNWNFVDFVNLTYDFNPFGVDLAYTLDKKDPSKFDVLVALLPSNQINKQFDITGNAYLDLTNQLNMAERIFLKFDKYNNASQSFDLRFQFPYLPIIRSGLIAEGQLDKRDSLVLDVSGKIGLQYSLNPRLQYSWYLQRDQSRLISINTPLLQNSRQLPEDLDYNYSALGFNIYYNGLDRPSNPRKGSYFQSNITAGLKKNVENASILQIQFPNEDFSFSTLYDSLAERSLKVGLSMTVDRYFEIGNYATIRLRGQGAWNFGSEKLFENEKLRLGGLQNFRGFSEKIFVADYYGMGSAEYRYLFDAQSNIYVFTDFGILQNSSKEDRYNFPYSFGLGLNLGTKAGVFGISYALGAHRDQALSFSEGRVNFGFVLNY